MIEFLIAAAIVVAAGYLLVNNFKNKSKGGCNCGCNSCKYSNPTTCSKNHNKKSG